MTPIHLLKKAKELFLNEHGKSHIEYEYPEALTWEKRVIFAPSRAEIIAYIKNQKLKKLLMYGISILISMMLLCHVIYSNIIIMKIIDIIYIILMSIFSILTLYLSTGGIKKYLDRKKIYRNKIIVYDMRN